MNESQNKDFLKKSLNTQKQSILKGLLKIRSNFDPSNVNNYPFVNFLENICHAWFYYFILKA
jgi:hypothetical protein